MTADVMTSSTARNDHWPSSSVGRSRGESRNEKTSHRTASIYDENDQLNRLIADVSNESNFAKEGNYELGKSSVGYQVVAISGNNVKHVVMSTDNQRRNDLPVTLSQQQQQLLPRRTSLSVSSNKRQTITSSHSQTSGSWQPFFSKNSRKSMTPEMFASSVRKQSEMITGNRRLRSASIAPTKVTSNGNLIAPYLVTNRREVDVENATGSLVIDLTRATLVEADGTENIADGDTDSGINRDAPNSPAAKDPLSERQNHKTPSNTQSSSAVNNELPSTSSVATGGEFESSVPHDDAADSTNDYIRQILNENGSTGSDSDDDGECIEDCCCNGDDRSHTVGGVFSAMSTEARQALTDFWIDVKRKQHRKCHSATSRRQRTSPTAEVDGRGDEQQQRQQQQQSAIHGRLRTAGSVERRHFISMLSRDQKKRSDVSGSRNESSASRPTSSIPVRRRPTPGETTWAESVSSVTSAGNPRLQRPKSETAQRRRPEVLARPKTSQALNRHQERSQLTVDGYGDDKFLRLSSENVEGRAAPSSDAGLFRITPATYDSRYEDMAVASALDEEWGRRGTAAGVPRRWNDVDEEECIVQSVVIAKCTAWLTNLQHYQHHHQQPQLHRKRMTCSAYY